MVFADLLLKRGCIDVIEEKYDMALLNLDAALRVQPDLADAWLVKTQIYATQGLVDQAVDSLENYIELTGDTSLYETVAQLRELQGDVAGAQEAYTKYAEGAGTSAEEVGFQNGVYLMEAAKFDEAIAAFEAYADSEVFGSGAMYNIGVCQMNLGNYAEAVAAFKACEEKGGTYEGLYYNRGVCSLLTGDFESAMADFIVSIEKEPYVEDARNNLAICQMQLGDYEAAVATFTEVIGDGEGATGEAGTLNLSAYFYRATCRAALGDAEGALADYTVCIENGYELGQSYYQRAQIYAAMGDTEKQNEDLANSLKYGE